MSCAKAGTSSAIPSTMSIIKTTSPERTICLPSISKIFGVSAAGKAAVEPVSAAALLGVGGSGNANVSVDVGPGNDGSLELQLLGERVHARSSLLDLPAGADVAVNLCRARRMR